MVDATAAMMTRKVLTVYHVLESARLMVPETKVMSFPEKKTVTIVK